MTEESAKIICRLLREATQRWPSLEPHESSPRQSFTRSLFLYVVVTITGGAVMILELLGTGIIGPH